MCDLYASMQCAHKKQQPFKRPKSHTVFINDYWLWPKPITFVTLKSEQSGVKEFPLRYPELASSRHSNVMALLERKNTSMSLPVTLGLTIATRYCCQVAAHAYPLAEMSGLLIVKTFWGWKRPRNADGAWAQKRFEEKKNEMSSNTPLLVLFITFSRFLTPWSLSIILVTEGRPCWHVRYRNLHQQFHRPVLILANSASAQRWSLHNTADSSKKNSKWSSSPSQLYTYDFSAFKNHHDSSCDACYGLIVLPICRIRVMLSGRYICWNLTGLR